MTKELSDATIPHIQDALKDKPKGFWGSVKVQIRGDVPTFAEVTETKRLD